MQRRDFLKSSVAVAGALKVGVAHAQEIVRAHNWDKYDFGSGPRVADRLNQGPFPQYPPDAVIPGDAVVMITTPSDEVVPNYGKGLITYITADMGQEEIKSDNIPQAIEDLARFPLGQQLYIRPTWREIQPRPGRLEFPPYLKLVFDLAKKTNKRVGLRVQMSAPDYTHDPALPDFVLNRVPKVPLILSSQENRASAERYLKNPHARYQPRFDDPFFQQAFKELVELLAAEFNGNPSIEFVDTFMYGFWGEGHTWPFSNNPFPDFQRQILAQLGVRIDFNSCQLVGIKTRLRCGDGIAPHVQNRQRIQSLAVGDCTPVCSLTATTVTPGTTAPVESTTVPEIEPVIAA